MAGIRARRAKRSGTKTSRKPRHPKKVSFAGVHPLVKENWDKTLTLQQNYARLGLLAALNGRTGGEQRRIDVVYQTDFIDDDVEDDSLDGNGLDEELEWRPLHSEDPLTKKLRELGPGESVTIDGRIYQYSPVDGIVSVDARVARIGSRVSKHDTTAETAGKIGANAVVDRIVVDNNGTTVIDKFKQEAANIVKIQRELSEQEALVFVALMKKYGDNYNAMAADIKLNRYQLSPGQLKRKFQRILKV